MSKKRKALTILDVARDPKLQPGLQRLSDAHNEYLENMARLGRECVDELADLIHRKEAFVEKRSTLPGGNPRVKTKATVVPTFDNVLVIRDEAPDKSPGGILMPDTGKEKPKRGKVIAVGPGRFDKDGRWMDPPCKAGDTVFVRHWNGADIWIENVAHEIFNAAEIICVETDDKEKIEKAYGKA